MVLVLEAIEYEYRFAEYRFAEYRFAEYRFAEYRFAEWLKRKRLLARLGLLTSHLWLVLDLGQLDPLER